MQNYSVTVRGRRPVTESLTSALDPRQPHEFRVGTRTIFEPSSRQRVEVPIYSDEKFSAGSSVVGPAIIDATDTTIFVPPNKQARRDQFLNYVITNGGAA
jgi:N-methylhydantoinase A/oxoprolinase/acetone carboxylase beta subunit